MKWSTRVTYIDTSTGEILNKRKIKNGEYIIIQTIKTKTQIYGDNRQRNYEHRCRKNNQYRIEFGTNQD